MIKIKRNDCGFTGPEMFFTIIIIILLVLTFASGFVIKKIGPDEEPRFKIQDVFYKENGEDFDTYIYLSNLGKKDGEATIRWKVYTTEDNRLADPGQGEISQDIEGRNTERVNFTFGPKPDREYTVEVTLYYEGEKVRTFNDYFRRFST